MTYTISKIADKKIELDMEMITQEIKTSIPAVLSIILTGGFSRGEGPVKKIGNKFYPYNDYDIQVICREKIKKEEIDRISDKISKKLGYKGITNFYPFKKDEQKLKNNFYIDLKCDTPKDLKELLPRIRNYELRNESKILYGEDLRKIIPDYPLEKIPLSEGAKLLLDRMSQMIEYYSTKGEYDPEFLTYIIQQAYAACLTSLLLLNRKYKIGYRRSLGILKECYYLDFKELEEKIPGLFNRIEKYINWKINPQKLPSKNVEKEWFIAKKDILEVSKHFFSRFLNKKIESTEQLSEGISKMWRKFYLPYLNEILKQKTKLNMKKISFIFGPAVSQVMKYKYYQRLKEMKINYPQLFVHKSPDLIIFSALIYIIDSIKENLIDQEKLKKGAEILSQVYPINGKDWEEMSIDYANAYIAFFLQKI